MKKIAIILAALMLLAALPLATHAGPPPFYSLIPNDDIVMEKTTPTIDGTIDWNEGWSAPAKLDFDTVGFFWRFQPMMMNADLYFAYSDDGLYFAADVTELSFMVAHNEAKNNMDYAGNCFLLSTDFGYALEDDGDDEPGSSTQKPEGALRYGYNGDILTLTLDPERLCQDAKQVYCPWYNIGIFENSEKATGYEAKVYRSQGNYGDITDRVESAAVLKPQKEYDALTTEGLSAEEVYGETPFMSGFVVEMFLPWEIVVEDIDAITYGLASVTKEELAADGAKISSAVQYMDRFYDDEARKIENWARYIVVCDVNDSGVLGAGSSGTPCDVNGLVLINGGEKENVNPFADVKEGKWYTKAIAYCYKLGYMNGTSATSFEPNSPVTRAMFVTVLSKIAGAETAPYKNVQTKFTDVKTGKWYSGPVAWAVENGYSSGLSDTEFGTNKSVSREQLATFLCTYATKSGIDTEKVAEIADYPDYAQISKWAKKPLAWAVENGLISGLKSGKQTLLSPKTNATRAQIALIVMNFMEGVNKSEYKPISNYKLSPWLDEGGNPHFTLFQ
ncbi:MAG: S-layer homology domain-containing protein [Clostridia bacterium]|nr:S-layer homology domain-containing protein [Clostridia bacterium]